MPYAISRITNLDLRIYKSRFLFGIVSEKNTLIDRFFCGSLVCL